MRGFAADRSAKRALASLPAACLALALQGCDQNLAASDPGPMASASGNAPGPEPIASGEPVLVPLDGGLFREGVAGKKLGGQVRYEPGANPGDGLSSNAVKLGKAGPVAVGDFAACRIQAGVWRACKVVSEEPGDGGFLAVADDGTQPTLGAAHIVVFDGGVAKSVEQRLKSSEGERQQATDLERRRPAWPAGYYPRPGMFVLARFGDAWREARLADLPDGGTGEFLVEWLGGEPMSSSARGPRGFAPPPRLPPAKLEVGEWLLARQPNGIWEPGQVVSLTDTHVRWRGRVSGVEVSLRRDNKLARLELLPGEP